MKITEFKKGENYNRGHVMVAVSGTEKELDFFSKMLADSDFSDSSADYREEEDKEGIFNDSYVVDRSYVKEFRAFYMSVKAMIKVGDHMKEAATANTPVNAPASASKVTSPIKATVNAPVVNNGLEMVVELSDYNPAQVAISALMKFSSVSHEEAVTLLQRSKGSVVDAALLHKADVAKIPAKPPEKRIKATVAAVPDKPEIVSNFIAQAPAKPADLDLFDKRSGLVEMFVRSTGEPSSVAVDYLEDASWIVEEAFITYPEDQKACSKANRS
ncbi:hypothetical protein IBO29_003923 [Salmonella enterica]|nr:hypothetical protein [Salmonella enterica]EBQ6118140.1 hypothetical protein [Salmonella enterica subsp. enterica serovar Praha]EAV4803772.1 hypothetical protein [Salmonella enterica]ECD1731559.1 hypothetical protein [Salmonella enterica subsp. enterica serovar Praha]ECD2135441.1 hypothetical protein [Salmonella enterica subsp. enterica serovar Praha]